MKIISYKKVLIIGIAVFFIVSSLASGINSKMDSSFNLLNKKVINYSMVHSPTVLLNENFSGTFPPDGWKTDYWVQCNESCYFDPPCACLFGEDLNDLNTAYISSKPVNASSYEKVILTFNLGIDVVYSNYISLYIRYRPNETSLWKDITPWDNPISGDMMDEYFQLGIYSFSHPNGCGDALQINWTSIGYGYYFNEACLDNVRLYGPSDPPSAPIIDGPSKGKPGIEYNYSFVSTDPDGDDVQYYIDWYSSYEGFWTEPYPSGEKIYILHTWPESGNFTISAFATAGIGEFSKWTLYNVTITKNKIYDENILTRILQIYPIFYHLIHLLVNK